MSKRKTTGGTITDANGLSMSFDAGDFEVTGLFPPEVEQGSPVPPMNWSHAVSAPLRMVDGGPRWNARLSDFIEGRGEFAPKHGPVQPYETEYMGVPVRVGAMVATDGGYTVTITPIGEPPVGSWADEGGGDDE